MRRARPISFDKTTQLFNDYLRFTTRTRISNNLIAKPPQHHFNTYPPRFQRFDPPHLPWISSRTNDTGVRLRACLRLLTSRPEYKKHEYTERPSVHTIFFSRFPLSLGCSMHVGPLCFLVWLGCGIHGVLPFFYFEQLCMHGIFVCGLNLLIGQERGWLRCV